MIISLDTEVSGLDLRHGALPYFVTTCNEDGEVVFWEWSVDPQTRKPIVPEEDKKEIQEIIRTAEILVLQNAKFDWAALYALDPEILRYWDWSKVRDTLLAGHLLASNRPHDLTSMALQYLNVNIEPYEIAVGQASNEARRYARSHYPDWRIAKKGLPEMPSASEKCWKMDMWLPRAIALHENRPRGEATVVNLTREEYDIRIDRSTKWGNPFSHLDPPISRAKYKVKTPAEAVAKYREWIQSQPSLLEEIPTLEGKRLGCHCKFTPPTSAGAKFVQAPCHGDVLVEILAQHRHPYWDVLRNYANADSEVTLPLWYEQEREIRRRGLWKIYEERLKVLPIAAEMEQRGVTVSSTRLEEIKEEYSTASQRAGRVCVNIAQSYGYDLQLPKGASPNDSLRDFMFNVLEVPKFKGKKAKTDKPTLNREAMEQYLSFLPERSRALLFVKTLLGKRSRDTACAFLEAYKRFGIPFMDGWLRLHPFLNITGTDTLRWSSENPNSQNCSKKESFNLRYAFGPAPGREWWACDYSNLELVIPATESGERIMMDLFEKPDDPPFYGSYHLMNTSIIYPDLFYQKVCPKCLDMGERCKDKQDRRIPCQPPVCLADIKGGFKKKYASTWYQWGKNFGFSFGYSGGEETCDRAAHKKGAYRAVKDRLKEHTKLNKKYIDYAEKHGYVETIPDKTVDPKRGYPVLCARTEYGKVLPTTPLNYHVQSTAMWCTMKAMIRCYAYLREINHGLPPEKQSHLILQVHDELDFDLPAGGRQNLPIVNRLRELMEQSGDDIGVPLRVNVEYHPNNWSKGEEL